MVYFKKHLGEEQVLFTSFQTNCIDHTEFWPKLGKVMTTQMKTMHFILQNIHYTKNCFQYNFTVQ
jgi:hypothetical protein